MPYSLNFYLRPQVLHNVCTWLQIPLRPPMLLLTSCLLNPGCPLLLYTPLISLPCLIYVQTDCWYSQLSSTLTGVVARAVHLAWEKNAQQFEIVGGNSVIIDFFIADPSYRQSKTTYHKPNTRTTFKRLDKQSSHQPASKTC